MTSAVKIRKTEDILSYCILFLALVWSIFPIYWIASMSLKMRVDIFRMPPAWIFTPILDNYAEVFLHSDFPKYFLNSFIIAISATALSLLGGVPAGYGLARLNLRRERDVSFYVLSTRMAPGVAFLIPFFLMIISAGLYDTYLAVILMHLVILLPLVIWLMRGFIEDAPRDAEEAAMVDGCSRLGAFMRTTLLMVLPGLASASVFAFLFSWNELMFGLTLTGINAKTAPAAVYNWVGHTEVNWGPLCATGLIQLVPGLIFFVFVQKYLARGLTAGILK